MGISTNCVVFFWRAPKKPTAMLTNRESHNFHPVKSSTTKFEQSTEMPRKRQTCKHILPPCEKLGVEGKQYYTGTCNRCNEAIVGCLLCDYSFAETSKARYSTDAYFGRHMSRQHSEMMHRSKVQKTSNSITVPDNNDECDFGGQDNDTTEFVGDDTGLIVDCVPEEVKDSEAKEDDDSMPGLASRADSASDDESMFSIEGDDKCGKDIDNDDDEESVIIPSPSDAIDDSDDSDFIPPRQNSSPVWDSMQALGQLGYGYEDFAFFCENTDSTVVDWVDNNQLFFWQKYLAKKEDSNDVSGGWRGLCHRAINRLRLDRCGMADVEISELLFVLNDVLQHNNKGGPAVGHVTGSKIVFSNARQRT